MNKFVRQYIAAGGAATGLGIAISALATGHWDWAFAFFTVALIAGLAGSGE